MIRLCRRLVASVINLHWLSGSLARVASVGVCVGGVCLFVLKKLLWSRLLVSTASVSFAGLLLCLRRSVLSVSQFGCRRQHICVAVPLSAAAVLLTVSVLDDGLFCGLLICVDVCVCVDLC